MIIILEDHTSDPVNRIGQSASDCYGGKTDRASNIRRAANCKDKGHLATLRFAYATFKISGISRVCSHQLVRIAHCGILQMSQRYVTQANAVFIRPPSYIDLPETLQREWERIEQDSIKLYNDAIASGMKKEDARYPLPQSCTTDLHLSMNFQGWRDFLKNRTAKAAQWEIRQVAEEVGFQLFKIAPEVFPEYAIPSD
jgi:thymidylate synthase (FAD)